MSTTTIQLSNETKEKIASFGQKGESYDDIIRKLYNIAVKEQLRIFLRSDSNCIPIKEAIEEVKKRWPK